MVLDRRWRMRKRPIRTSKVWWEDTDGSAKDFST
jgi:hypothetical protein